MFRHATIEYMVQGLIHEYVYAGTTVAYQRNAMNIEQMFKDELISWEELQVLKERNEWLRNYNEGIDKRRSAS